MWKILSNFFLINLNELNLHSPMGKIICLHLLNEKISAKFALTSTLFVTLLAILLTITFISLQMSEKLEGVAKHPPARLAPWIGEFEVENGTSTYFVFVEQSIYSSMKSFDNSLFAWFALFYVEYHKQTNDMFILSRICIWLASSWTSLVRSHPLIYLSQLTFKYLLIMLLFNYYNYDELYSFLSYSVVSTKHFSLTLLHQVYVKMNSTLIK